jgi:hypothetical protein
MGYQTTADDHRDAAVENVQAAIVHLSEIVVNACHGHDEFREEYKADLRKSLYELTEVRDRIKV